jgi:hypothetical protein
MKRKAATQKPEFQLFDSGWVMLRGEMARQVQTLARRCGVTPGELVRVIVRFAADELNRAGSARKAAA